LNRKKVTLKDIAREAKVSTTTVSLVLNEDRRVTLAEETRQLIKETALNLGYDFSRLESRKQGNRNILFVMDEWHSSHIGTSFFSNVADHLKAGLASKGFQLIEGEFGSMDSAHLKYLLKSQPRLIITPSLLLIQALRKHHSRIPVICLQGDRQDIPDDHLTSVLMVDDYRVGELAALELMEKGAENTALIFPEGDHRSIRQRIDGFEARWSGGNRRSELLQVEDCGYPSVEQILTGRMEDFDSFYFFSDAMAIYGIRIFHNAGLSIPSDKLIIGTDNLYWGGYSVPSLTTMDLKEEQFARYILDRLPGLQESREWATETLSIPPELIRRESTEK